MELGGTRAVTATTSPGTGNQQDGPLPLLGMCGSDLGTAGAQGGMDQPPRSPPGTLLPPGTGSCQLSQLNCESWPR